MLPHLVYTVLGINPRASGMLRPHSANLLGPSPTGLKKPALIGREEDKQSIIWGLPRAVTSSWSSICCFSFSMSWLCWLISSSCPRQERVVRGYFSHFRGPGPEEEARSPKNRSAGCCELEKLTYKKEAWSPASFWDCSLSLLNSFGTTLAAYNKSLHIHTL